jgi:hypothetical protein
MKSSTFTVVYDACVLYPAALRDLLVHLAHRSPSGTILRQQQLPEITTQLVAFEQLL